ncbi:hypothetical protein K378_04058 [Streptomyces sp. Amel2xB2]|uniref:hypothetical protein n=1 Tax=Streptomyces sp. Amel2xB2 TaxID=1305829 RepID=UPI000DBF8504|nr:hypothetical protein [Streptomyces sp. Amel2xB2]RAJ61698.1 hypothetical protein K378_04058 [Streptomyces sp. Amel2xB2]
MVTRVPGRHLRHRIHVEPYLGDSAYGPRYGEPVECVPAQVAAVRKQVADKDGREVLATAQVITGPELECPPGSRLTLPDGRTATAISTARHTAPGLPVPACTEVMCQ